MENLRCPHCYAANILKSGYYRRSKEVIQRWYCKSCNRRFIQSDKKRTTLPQKILWEELKFLDANNISIQL